MGSLKGGQSRLSKKTHKKKERAATQKLRALSISKVSHRFIHTEHVHVPHVSFFAPHTCRRLYSVGSTP